MTDDLDGTLEDIAAHLDAPGIPYMVVGSIAVSTGDVALWRRDAWVGGDGFSRACDGVRVTA